MDYQLELLDFYQVENTFCRGYRREEREGNCVACDYLENQREVRVEENLPVPSDEEDSRGNQRE